MSFLDAIGDFGKRMNASMHGQPIEDSPGEGGGSFLDSVGDFGKRMNNAYHGARGDGSMTTAGAKNERDNLTAQFNALQKTQEQMGLPVDPELADKFHAASLGGQRGMVSGLSTNINMRQQATAQKMRDLLLQQAQGDDTVRSNLLAGKEPGAGVSQVTAEGMQQISGARFNKLMQQWNAIAGNDASPQLQADTAMKFAQQAGMPMADQLTLSRESLNGAKMAKDLALDDEQPVPWKSPAGNDYVKYHHTLVADRAPIDTAGMVAPEGYELLSNGRGGVQALRKPSAAAAQKLNVDTMVEGEKALQGLDDNIAAWTKQAARAKDDPKVAAPDPKVLAGLNKRRARLQQMLEGSDEGEAGAPASGKGAAADTADSTPPEVQALMAEANAAIAKGADKNKVKARLAAKLKEKGFSLKE